MKRVPLFFVVALACSSTSGAPPIGDFSGPTGLAIAPLVDRDLLFIANQGSNELRAMTLCHTPNASSCPTNEDFQFLPAPIRVLVGSILTGERPLRLAGIPLSDGALDAQNKPVANHGAVLVTSLGAVRSDGVTTPALQLFDAANLLAASRSKSTQPAPAVERQTISLLEAPVDVVASNVPGTSVTAFAVSQAANGSPGGTLMVLNVTLVNNVAHATPNPSQQCAIDFVPTRLALIPGNSDLVAGVPQHVYVADGTPRGTAGGTGDGMVEVSVAAIPPFATGAAPPCSVVRRIPASDPLDSPRRPRPLNTIAVSPPSKDVTGTSQPGGLFMLGVTLGDPALCAEHAFGVCADVAQPVPAGAICVDQGIPNCGAGRVVMFSNVPGTTSALLRAPGTPDPSGPGSLPAEPLRPPGAAQEVAFMGRDDCTPPNRIPADLRCTSLNLGVPEGTAQQQVRSLIGLVSTVDGTTFFVDIDNQRFFDDVRDSTKATDPVPIVLPSIPNPQPAPGVAPTVFTIAAADATNSHKRNPGWVNAGVTRSAQWRAGWHSSLPGLESVAGTLTRAQNGGPITLTLSGGKDLTPWITSPEFQLGAPSACSAPYPQCVGDFVRVKSYSSPDPLCGAFAVVPITTDIPIVAVNAGSIVLQPVPGFDPDPQTCFSGKTVGGTFEVHAGDSTAGGWIVVEDFDVLGRLPHGGPTMIVTGPRLDYPLTVVQPSGPSLPQPSPRDIALAFSITGPEPTVAGTFFTAFVSSGAALTGVRDPTPAGNPGYAGPILVYNSTRRVNDRNDEIIFTALTGSNSLLYTIPAQFGLPGTLLVFY